MEEIGISHHPRRRPNGIIKADREARKSDDLLKRDFHPEEPLTKCVTDITEIKASDGKLYVSAVFDCFDASVIGLAMDTNMKAPLCVQALENTAKAYPGICGAIIHSDRGSQYTSQLYRSAIRQYGIQQSMNSAGGRCHDNARCESMWARMKSELLYDRYDTEKMTTDELRTIIWRYFISYWNNRRICSANGGRPPMAKRQQYYDSLKHWKKEYEEHNGSVPTRGSGNFESDEAKEIARLRRQLRDAQDALDILKKTSAYWKNIRLPREIYIRKP